jgi:hypothetical protein
MSYQIDTQNADLTPPFAALEDGTYKVEITGAKQVTDKGYLPIVMTILEGNQKGLLAGHSIGLQMNGMFDTEKCEAWDAITGSKLGTWSDKVRKSKEENKPLDLDFITKMDNGTLRYVFPDKPLICTFTVRSYFSSKKYNDDVIAAKASSWGEPNKDAIAASGYPKYYGTSKTLRPFVEETPQTDAPSGLEAFAEPDAPGIFNPDKANAQSRLGTASDKVPWEE